MASLNRQERQLMRQRGAGSRNVTSTGFGLNVGVDGSRQDRQQMRQRGAGNRKVTDIDFGFSFRTPARSRRSASMTSNNSNARQSSPTANRRSRDPSALRSRRSTSKASEQSQSQRASQESSAQLDAQDGPSTKRRRITTHSADKDVPEDGLLRNARVSRRTPSSTFAIAEVADERMVIEDLVLEEDAQHGSSPSHATRGDNEKENTAPGDGKSATKRKKRKSIVQNGTRRKKRVSETSITHARPTPRESPITQALRSDTPVDDEESLLGRHPDKATEASRAGEPLRANIKRRKKRRSVILVKKKRRSSEGTKNQPRTVRAAVTPAEQGAENERRPKGQLERMIRTVSLIAKSSPIIQSIEVDDASDEEYVDEEESPEPPTPAPLRKPARGTKTARPTTSIAAKAKSQKSSRRKSTFPILTHRLTNTDVLPTIREEAEIRVSDDGEAGTPATQAFGHRIAPNSVDVLAQICRETVETAVERFENEKSTESRAIRQRKRSALEAFGADLDGRLFDISAAVKDRIDLEARVRKVKRQKADLQAQWIEVRNQRERIALKCDRVRRENWENEQEREDKWRISEAARRAELELEDNPVEEEDSLEFLLRSVADEVTKAQSGCGLLKRLKAFNNQLEGIAGVPVGRG